MYRKFLSFEELVNEFRVRSGSALRYADENGSVCDISYPELAEMITSEMYHIKAENSSVEVVFDERSPETIINIFAHVMAGCDIIVSGPLVPEDFTSQAAGSAQAAKDFREGRRDSRGRVIGARGEGELLFFTSGTTSRRKIVRLTSRSLCASAWSGQNMLECGEGDVILCILPVAHVFGFVCSMLWGLSYGATIALGRGVKHLVDDPALFKPTILPGVPSLISAMVVLDSLNPELRVALIGAAPCTSQVTDALKAKGIKVYVGYGLTETSSGVAITQDIDEPDALYPCPDADIRIEDDGEITIATPCMMEGYIGDEPMFDEDRFFTGDLGWLDEKGRLHLKGRKKDVLLLPDGSKIFCPEYEEEIARVTGFTDLGVTAKKGRAVLAAGSCAGSPEEVESIKKNLLDAVEEFNKNLPRAQQIYEVIFSAEALPRTATGKLRRYELQDRIPAQ